VVTVYVIKVGYADKRGQGELDIVAFADRREEAVKAVEALLNLPGRSNLDKIVVDIVED